MPDEKRPDVDDDIALAFVPDLCAKVLSGNAAHAAGVASRVSAYLRSGAEEVNVVDIGTSAPERGRLR
jgi:hypothetical protein